MGNRRHRGGIVGPLILIATGTILLLNNLNLASISLVELGLKLWPALIIALGLDLLIPRRSVWTSLLALLLIAGVLLGSFWLFDTVETDPAGASELSYPLDGVRRAQITLDPAIGELVVERGAQDEMLVSGRYRGRSSGKPKFEAQASGDGVNLRLTTASERFGGLGTLLTYPFWELRMAEQVPVGLTVDMGVGTQMLDVRQLELQSLEANMGVGRTRVQLPAGQSLQATIEGGIGELEVVVPAGAAVEIRLDRGIASIQLPSGYTIDGEVIRSPEGAAGQADIQLTLDLGIGLVRILES